MPSSSYSSSARSEVSSEEVNDGKKKGLDRDANIFEENGISDQHNTNQSTQISCFRRALFGRLQIELIHDAYSKSWP